VPCWRSSLSWEVQSPDSEVASGVSKKKRRAFRRRRRQPPRMPALRCRAALQKLASISQYPTLGRHNCFHGAVRSQWWTHLPLHGCCMSRTHQPEESTGCFLRQGGRRGNMNMFPCHRRALSFRGSEPATRHATSQLGDLHECGLELCLRKNRELCGGGVCGMPANLFEAPDQQCIV